MVSYGSDWDNIPEPDPWFALEGMITRRYPGKPELGVLNPNERLDRETAIELYRMALALDPKRMEVKQRLTALGAGD